MTQDRRLMGTFARTWKSYAKDRNTKDPVFAEIFLRAAINMRDRSLKKFAHIPNPTPDHPAEKAA